MKSSTQIKLCIQIFVHKSYFFGIVQLKIFVFKTSTLAYGILQHFLDIKLWKLQALKEWYQMKKKIYLGTTLELEIRSTLAPSKLKWVRNWKIFS